MPKSQTVLSGFFFPEKSLENGYLQTGRGSGSDTAAQGQRIINFLQQVFMKLEKKNSSF